INMFSSTLASLSEARRFAHSLGVLGLFLLLKPRLAVARSVDEETMRSLEVACLVHDVATPAFGHLLEYQLRHRFGWHHETELDSIIKGTYRPENIHHQLYYGNQLKLHQRIRDVGVDPDFVCSLVKGSGGLGELISGTIDLDNVDSVFRMHSLLGLGWCPSIARVIVSSMVADAGGVAFRESGLDSLTLWIEARRRAYEVLVFDEDTVAGQAMLSHCFDMALECGYLSPELWHLTDDQMLAHLLRFEETKTDVKRLTVGEVYTTLSLGWYDFDDKVAARIRQSAERRALESELQSELGLPVIIYYFEDEGSFSKELNLQVVMDDGRRQTRNVSSKSNSMVIGVFSRTKPQTHDEGRCERVVADFLASQGLDQSSMRKMPELRCIYGLDYQKRF
ncbi:MAG: HD domain-containing protein, partial [Thermoplasmata archaeon]